MNYRRVFEKIKENAEDGLRGTAGYKDDRLMVIAGMAASALLTMDKRDAEIDGAADQMDMRR